jgi:DNA polymerase-4
MTQSLCRNCYHQFDTSDAASKTRCPSCHNPRILTHPELHGLTIAHLDCDAFYAAVEKRDNPTLANKPVIIGGGKRGVVSTCCYIARTYGVHSAQPMFKALKACPDAVVIKPRGSVYSEVGREIKSMMRNLTPLVEPLSIDEAFLDLSGTQRLHGHSPAQTMARLITKIEEEVGVTVSVGLSYCKFLAKIASDLDKPRGFSVIGKEEAVEFLSRQPVSLIWGVGKSFGKKLQKDGITTIGQLQNMDEKALIKRYGAMGFRLSQLSRGEDARRLNPRAPMKSISHETTFFDDISDIKKLKEILWRLSENVSARAKKSDLAGETINLKLRTQDFKILSRSRTLADPTQLADKIFNIACEMLDKEAGKTKYRLIGVGLANLCEGSFADPPDLIDQEGAKRADVERAMDKVRGKFGQEAIQKGRGMKNR